MTDSTNETTNHREKRKKRKRSVLANVIRVEFGAGGGRVQPELSPSRARAGTKGVRDSHSEQWRRTEAGASPLEPVTDLFSVREVARLLDLSEGRLRSLDRAHIVSPTGSRRGRRAYTFQDLIALRATLLLSKDVKPREMARAIGALKQTLPKVTRPLQELRIVSDGRRVVVRTEGGAFEPLTGQMVLDFQVGVLRDDVVRVLRPESAATRARTAYDLYVKASTLDEDPATYDEAEALYRRAIELDADLSIAYTNLGNIRFRRGDDQGAEELYHHALSIDPSQPEAHYNLGYVMLERGHAESAVTSFEKALLRDARFSDAHFNLAMALEQLGERQRAHIHWRRYLELEPRGTWADIARQHL